MSAPTSANPLPAQTPNTSAPLAEIDYTLQQGDLSDARGEPVTGTLHILARVTQPWRYLFGTFIQRSKSVNPAFSLTANATYSQSQLQALIAQVEALSKVVGQS